MKIARSLALAMSLCLLQGSAPAAQDPPNSAAYLLVIDHSSSMNDPENEQGGQSRWDAMVERATGAIDFMPLESRVWIAIFSTSAASAKIRESVINSPRDREALKKWIEHQKDPVGGTDLYNTMELAFLKAEELSQQNPNRFISVLIYSDGADTESARAGYSPEERQAQLVDRFESLVSRNGNVWTFMTQLKKGLKAPLPPGSAGGHILLGQPKIPISVQISPSRLQLPSPTRSGDPQIAFSLTGLDQAPKEVRQAPVTVKFEGDLNGELSENSFTLGQAELDSKLICKPEDKQALSPDQVYKGEVQLQWPELDKYVILGPSAIPVQFDKEDAPKIKVLYPTEDNPSCLAKNDILFGIETIQGAKVQWTVDGTVEQDDTRQEFRKAFGAEGEHSVQIVATDPATGLKSEPVIIPITIHQATITVDPFEGDYFVGAKSPLSFTSKGGFTSFEWKIDGRSYICSDVEKGEGGARGQIVHLFRTAGRIPVQVVGHHPVISTRVFSEEVYVTILARPNVTITSPDDGASLEAREPAGGNPHVLNARVEGPVKYVRWVLIDPENPGAPIREATVPVEEGSSTSSIEQFFMEDGPKSLTIAVEALDNSRAPFPNNNAVGIAQAGFFTRSEHTVSIVPPTRSLALDSPATGSTLTPGKEQEFVFRANGSGFQKVDARLTNKLTGEELFNNSAPVDGEGYARFSVPINTDEDVVVEIRGTGYLTAGTEGAQALPASYRVEFPAVVAELHVTPGANWSKPVEARVVGNGLTHVSWDFGNGARKEGPETTSNHTYETYGEVTVTAVATGPGGKKTSVLRETVLIPYDEPVASFRLLSGDEAVTSVDPDDLLAIEDNSTGDIVSRRYFLDGEPLADGTGTLIFDEETDLGAHMLTLEVTGPTSTSGEVATRQASYSFRVIRYNHGLFYTVLAAVIALLAFIGRTLTGNAPKGWKYAVAYPASEGFESARVRPLKSYWSRISKAAHIPLKSVMNVSEWRAEPRSRHELIVKRGADEVTGFAEMHHSARGLDGGAIDEEKQDTSRSEIIWRMWDDCDPIPEHGTEWLVKIIKKPGGAKLDGFFLALSILAGLAAIYLTYQHVYSIA
jgi:hypothetical protein